MKQKLKKEGVRLLMVCIASVLMAVNIKSFVRTGGLYPGGATGLSLLIQRALDLFMHIKIPFTAINLVLNAIPVYIGFRYIGKKFTLYSCLVIVLTSIFTDIIPGYAITCDTLLIAVFGGIINGAMISLCLLENATTGGTDFISIFLSEKKGIDAWNIIFAFNVCILIVAGFMFGWDKALYSIIFQYASTEVLRLLYKKYQQMTLLIVTNHAMEVYQAISKVSNHGATIMVGEGPYEKEERNVVYSVVSSQDCKKVIKTIKETDSKAFVNVLKTEQVSGKFYLKPNE